jgi:hypothetical protein
MPLILRRFAAAVEPVIQAFSPLLLAPRFARQEPPPDRGAEPSDMLREDWNATAEQCRSLAKAYQLAGGEGGLAGGSARPTRSGPGCARTGAASPEGLMSFLRGSSDHCAMRFK